MGPRLLSPPEVLSILQTLERERAFAVEAPDRAEPLLEAFVAFERALALGRIPAGAPLDASRALCQLWHGLFSANVAWGASYARARRRLESSPSGP